MSSMQTYDLIIIGAGVVGAAIARELSRYNLTIAVLEKEAEPAFGISKSNSGIIHPGTQNPPESLKGRLCVRGNHLIRKLAKELGIHFQEVGELVVVFDRHDLPGLESLLHDGRRLGVKGLRIVDREWLRKHEPNLNSKVYAALYAPTAGIISPYRMTYDLLENAQANGVTVHTSVKVTSLVKKESFIINNTFAAAWVINAAGLYTDEIAGLAGINDFTITPRKGEEYLLDKKKEHLVNHIIFPLPTATSKGILVIKTSDGNPMIGPTAEDIPDKTDRTTTVSGLHKVLDSTTKLIPSLNQGDIIAYFAGLRPIAGKDFIIRHESAVPGLITVAGIQSPGLTAAPAIAEMVTGILQHNGCKLKKKSKFIHTRKPSTHLFAIPLAKTKKLIEADPAYGDIVCRCEMVSTEEIREAIRRGARTLDGIKFRTRAQAGRCHGGFCTTRIMKIMAEELKIPITSITKRGRGSEIVLEVKK
jgi:glycerol-3-phosphate dehydrogenase